MSDVQIYAGIDIGGTNIKFGLFDAEGKILYREQRPTMAEKGPTPLLHLITNIAERLMYHAAEENYSVRWIGVGSPGAVDHRTGRVIGPCPNIEGWQGTEIAAAMRERLNMPVFVDNDVNSMALAETRFGAAMGARSVVCVTVGTGVGGGVIIDGKVVHGANSSAGELGHMTIEVDGPLCACGNHGCIESFCSSQAIINRTRTKLKNGMSDIFRTVLDGSLDNLTIKKIFAAARKGDQTANEVVIETGRYLGVGLSGIVNLLNPEVVVIGGGITDGGAGFVGAVNEEIKRRAFTSATENLTVTKAALGNDAGFMGAGLLGEVNQ
ncbi:MAG: ROK family protein [Candidatus Zixiibacteriota bacterium]|nr:MAG: ROK family protein [candidate division Zixibacteria bacterium]